MKLLRAASAAIAINRVVLSGCSVFKPVSSLCGTTSFLFCLCSQVEVQRFQVSEAQLLAGVGTLKGGPPEGAFADLYAPDSKQIGEIV